MCCSLLHKDLLEFIPECAAFPWARTWVGWWCQSPWAIFPLFGFIPPIPAILVFPLAGNTAVLLPVCLLRTIGCLIVSSYSMSHGAAFNSTIPILGFFQGRNHLTGQFLQNPMLGPFAPMQRGKKKPLRFSTLADVTMVLG